MNETKTSAIAEQHILRAPQISLSYDKIGYTTAYFPITLNSKLFS